MAITAALVKELRERTSAGMMECKKALVEMGGDIEAAAEHMRKTGMAKADKKAGRAAAEGLIIIKLSDDAKTAAMVEVNCETDFLAKDENFVKFVNAVGDCALANQPADVDALSALVLEDGTSVEDARKALIAKMGENMNVRRMAIIKAKGNLFAYSHGSRIGVVIDVKDGSEKIGKDLAMHIAAIHPVYVDESEVPQNTLDTEKEIYTAQAQESGKPAEIIEKMVQGRIKKYLKGITLLGQPFVKDPDQTVEQLLKKENATVTSFVRLEVGEGVEKKTENFADEVMAQIEG